MTNQSGARVSTNRSRSPGMQRADSIKDRRLHFSTFPSTTHCGAAQKHVRLPGWRHRGDTRWQGRDLYPGQSDWLTWPISRSAWLIDTWCTCDWPPGGRWRHLAADGGTSWVTSQRWHPVTRAWPISRSGWLIDLTYIQVDWQGTRKLLQHVNDTKTALTTIRRGVTSALDQSEAGIYVSVGSAIGHQVALQASFNIDLIQKLSFQTCLYTTNGL